MKIPIPLKVAALVLVTTALYTYIGQLVPQKEVAAPEVIEMSRDMTTDQLVEIGQEIFVGKGLCSTCHTIGKSGALRFPDLDGIAVRAAERVPGLNAVEYLAQSMYEPDDYIVEGFNPGMPRINKPPVALTDDEIRAVIAYLQTLGGTATLTMETPISYMGGAEPAPAEGDSAAAPAAEG